MIRLYREDLIHHGTIYMRRWVLRLVGVGELRLHHVRTPDGVRGYLHDHPWPFLTWLLWGSYTHQVQEHPPQGPVVTERRRWLSLRLLRRGNCPRDLRRGPGRGLDAGGRARATQAG